MGMPELIIAFKKAAETAVLRSGRGIVALILKDTANDTKSYSLSKENQVEKGHWTAENLDYIQKTFLGGPNLVLIERVGSEETLEEALGRLKNKKWNYLAIPDLTEDEAATVLEWIIAQRKNTKTFKAVLPNCAADNEGIINFATEGIEVGTKKYTAAQYCGRIAGILAGTPLDNSCTYTVLPEVTAITESADADKDINAGKLILFNDGTQIKIARGVNSLVELGETKTEDMKKIKIVEGMDLVRDDIRNTWNENYVGKKVNKYDNKILFVNAVNIYFRALAVEGVMDDSYDNLSFIDIAAQRTWLSKKNSIWVEKTDEEVKTANTGSYAFIGANAMFCDAMEDLNFAIYM